MARSITSNAQEFLDQNFGTEPVVIIEVQWVDGGSIYTYSDKPSSKQGKILAVSRLDNTITVQGIESGVSGDSQELSVTLDDTDSKIKDLIDAHDPHKRIVWVYQSFVGLDDVDKILIFKGQISSPITWREGDRTVSFTVLNRIEDAEVGFSIEDISVPHISNDILGEPWPLVFGSVVNSPALKARSPRQGFLREGFGIQDFVLKPKLEQLAKICCTKKPSGQVLDISGNLTDSYTTDIYCECKKSAVKCGLESRIALQEDFELDSFDIGYGDSFPQGVPLILGVNGARVSGQFNGTEENPSETFVVTKYFHPKLADITVPPIKTFTCKEEPETDNSQEKCQITGGSGDLVCDTEVVSTTGETGWGYLSTFKEADFFWAGPGSPVTLEQDKQYVYIVNLLPSTVRLVRAYRTPKATNQRSLELVPSELYTTRMSDFNGYMVTELVFDRPLSSLNEGWEDEIYVTHESSVGPNTVDILEWLIDKYTDFTWDSSFDDIRPKVDLLPMNFMVPGRPNILQLLREIAFQARCAISLRNDVFHLTFLPDTPIENGSIVEDDVIQNTLQLEHTPTEDLVTKFVAEWRTSYDMQDHNKVILRSNVGKYGTKEQVFDFFCFNTRNSVGQSAIFWMIRLSNTWRRVTLTTPIKKIALESLDGVFQTLPYFGVGEIKCRVETAAYDSDNNTINFEIWTPLLAGSRTPYDFAYFDDIDIVDVFAIPEGSGPNVDVTPPDGHILGAAAVPGEQLRGGGTNVQPPDRDCPQCVVSPGARFFLPGGTTFVPGCGEVPFCPADCYAYLNSANPCSQEEPGNQSPPGNTPPDMSSTPPEIIENDYIQEERNNSITEDYTKALEDATDADPDDQKEAVENALNKLPSTQDLVDANICHYTLTVFFINVTVVRIAEGETCDNGSFGVQTCGSDDWPSTLGRCNCNDPGAVGCFVGNQVAFVGETFAFATEASRDNVKNQIDKLIDSEATVGETHPVFTVSGEYNPGDCTDPEGEANIIGYNGGSTSVAGYKGFWTTGIGDLESPC